MSQSFRLTVNGIERVVDTDPDTPLLSVLRNDLDLRGSRFGCGVGRCGACFVQLDGVVVASCDTPIWSAADRTVVTVEGLADGDTLHPVQRALLDTQGAQCGYCVSGIVVSAAALLRRDPHPDEPAVVAALERNLCRCGVQRRMIAAIVQAGRGGAGRGEVGRGEVGRGEVGRGGAGGSGAGRSGAGRGDAGAVDGRDVKPATLRPDHATRTQPTGCTVSEVEVPSLPKNLVANPILSRWVAVDPVGVIGLRVGKVELGQGISTALAQLAVDELQVDLAQIRMLPANTVTGPDEGFTAGSMSISDCGPALRLVAANVRDLFVRAAADRLGVDAGQITVDTGRFTGPDAATSTSYAELAGVVDLNVAVDPRVPLAAPGERRLTGTSVARLDLPDKVTGVPRFIHDLRLPGQLYGRVIRPPSPGAVLVDLDPATAERHGARLVRDGWFIGVVGPDEAAVVRAAAALRTAARWDERDTLPDEGDLNAYLRAGPHESTTMVDDGAAGDTAGRTLRATYSRPFLAHAAMAPSCGIACWSADGRVRVWSHTQGVYHLRDAIAGALDLDPASVTVEHAEGAGCYGHNAADDAAFDAVLIARAVPGHPVQVQWTRQDELSWAPFGSAMTADVAGTLDDTGRLTSWSYEVWSQGHTARPGYSGVPGLLSATTLARPATYPAAADPPVAAGSGTLRNAVPGYDVGRRRIVGHRLLSTPIRSSALRSLGAFLNVFAIESFMDEAAELAGQDPLDFRLAHLADERGRRVLRTAAAAAGWATPTPEGVGRGLGYARYKGRGAYCAVVAEVAAEHEVRVRRLTIAVDVGRVVNPDGVRNQISGGATQATSWATKERVRFDRRRVTSVDWERYPILRFSEVPEVAVEIVADPDEPSVGAGEAAQGPTAAAIANAVADAIGVRVRDLPLTTESVVRAIESA